MKAKVNMPNNRMTKASVKGKRDASTSRNTRNNNKEVLKRTELFKSRLADFGAKCLSNILVSIFFKLAEYFHWFE
ncbi:hypothetical protein [Xanthocytophaga agilis]|uniref:Uncharacterized protein n=1 Tax=Xanthocytophaga agilis TaxID=3048010 RepID=A0AAE3R8D0_9BACT|nr:hypothetical protein [Xanthocytophaga agilis]MDJ1505736.1 hypothetical protein [Xanthocytophaga agilis]